MHDNHLIHRDLKPANFVVGLNEPGIVYCIDFGLSKRYRHPHTLQHIPYRDGRTLTGTPRYASVANHRGIETSRRDDLESIGYILVYFLLGKLPWQGLKLPSNVNGTASRKHQLILDKKNSTPLEELCRGCPQEFQEFLQYCRDLKFDAKPDMAYLRGIFRQLYENKGYANVLEWDWELDQTRPSTEPVSSSVPATNQTPQQQQPSALANQTSQLQARPTYRKMRNVDEPRAQGRQDHLACEGLAAVTNTGPSAPPVDRENPHEQHSGVQNDARTHDHSRQIAFGATLDAAPNRDEAIRSMRMSESSRHAAVSTPPPSTRVASSAQTVMAVGVTSISSRPWTAQTDAMASIPGNSIATPSNVAASAGQASSQATVPIPRLSPPVGSTPASNIHNTGSKVDAAPGDGQSCNRRSAEGSSEARAAHGDAAGGTRPISSREQVVVSITTKSSKQHHQAPREARVSTESRGTSTLRPRTAPGRGHQAGGKASKSGTTRRNPGGETRSATASSRGGPQAWVDPTGSAARREWMTLGSQMAEHNIGDDAFKVSQHPGFAHGENSDHMACGNHGRGAHSHFVGSPLSFVRHRRASSRDEGCTQLQRPQSGHAGSHHHSTARYARSRIRGVI